MLPLEMTDVLNVDVVMVVGTRTMWSNKGRILKGSHDQNKNL